MTASLIMDEGSWQTADGKVILFGEHAVVYGVKALAGGIPAAVRARATKIRSGSSVLTIAPWHIHFQLGDAQENALLHKIMSYLVDNLNLGGSTFHLEIQPTIPHASGLGASAAVAVASIRALAACFQLSIPATRVNELAYGCETLSHGSPSGLDNTLSTYGGLLSFQRLQSGIQFHPLACARPIPLIVAQSGKKGFTAETVRRVAEARAAKPAVYTDLFAAIADISREAEQAIAAGDFALLAGLMNRNQQCLREMQVSCREIEGLIETAKAAGAIGAKLTGSGDGGAVLIYAGDKEAQVKAALDVAGIDSFSMQLGQI